MEGYTFIEKANVTWFNVTLKPHKATGWEKYVLWIPFLPATAPVWKLPFNLTDYATIYNSLTKKKFKYQFLPTHGGMAIGQLFKKMLATLFFFPVHTSQRW